jgi:hypothetical protein
MDVYLLTEDPGDYGSKDIGIYASVELAKKAADTLYPDKYLLWTKTQEHGWVTTPMYPDFSIQKFRLKES